MCPYTYAMDGWICACIWHLIFPLFLPFGLVIKMEITPSVQSVSLSDLYYHKLLTSNVRPCFHGHQSDLHKDSTGCRPFGANGYTWLCLMSFTLTFAGGRLRHFWETAPSIISSWCQVEIHFLVLFLGENCSGQFCSTKSWSCAALVSPKCLHFYPSWSPVQWRKSGNGLTERQVPCSMGVSFSFNVYLRILSQQESWRRYGLPGGQVRELRRNKSLGKPFRQQVKLGDPAGPLYNSWRSLMKGLWIHLSPLSVVAQSFPSLCVCGYSTARRPRSSPQDPNVGPPAPSSTSEMTPGPDQTLGSSGGFLLSPENFSSSANSEDPPRGRHPFPSHRIPFYPIALFSWPPNRTLVPSTPSLPLYCHDVRFRCWTNSP